MAEGNQGKVTKLQVKWKSRSSVNKKITDRTITSTRAKPQPSVILVTQDKETGKTTSWYQYINDEDD